jgi:hypothetical protein
MTLGPPEGRPVVALTADIAAIQTFTGGMLNLSQAQQARVGTTRRRSMI